jgi:membrane protease YdiL (CAAX protease family)
VGLPAILARGFNLFALELPVALVLVMLGAYTGPLAASLLVTGLTQGKPGLKAFLRRFIQWRVGWVWYLLLIVGYPLIYLVGLLPLVGPDAYAGAWQKLPAFFTAYLPMLAICMVFPALGEEPGWRGFALPRLQQRYHPLLATLILGSMHALWHVPAYFIPGMYYEGPFNLLYALSNSGSIIAASILWTWFYNQGRNSIFFAMLIHAASNASPSMVSALLGPIRPDPAYQFMIFGVVAAALLALSRGRLGYRSDNLTTNEREA